MSRAEEWVVALFVAVVIVIAAVAYGNHLRDTDRL